MAAKTVIVVVRTATILLLVHGTCAGSARAQWLDTFAEPNGVEGVVYALLVEPDGHLIVGGSFSQVGPVSANNIARWDGEQWHAMGDGFNSAVSALAHDDDGSIYAGGGFTISGVATTRAIARWTGSVWEALGEGLLEGGMFGNNVGWVDAIAVVDSGVFAGGDFRRAGNVDARGLAFWNGAEWLPVGGGVDGYGGIDSRTDDVMSLLAHNGLLYVGGNFDVVGGEYGSIEADTSVGFGVWDGSAWVDGPEPLAFGQPGISVVRDLIVYDGRICGASNTQFPGSDSIACWSETWMSPGSGVTTDPGGVFSLAADAEHLYALGSFTVRADTSVVWLARWNGNEWLDVGGGLSTLPTDNPVLAADDSLVYMGFSGSVEAGGVTSRGLAVWRKPTSSSTDDSEADAFTASLFPNPFFDSIRIEVPGNSGQVKVEMFDLLGRRVLDASGSGSVVDIDTSLLRSGVYVVSVRLSQPGMYLRRAYTLVRR